ncbi:MAG TPA: hypothetical protein VKA84_10225 [Gemmatimonadaceae bacterium]|nr:hypothetical protein [Gemmatimonadaceae bacterium]
MRLDQRVEVTGGESETPGPGTTSTTLQVLTRSIVQRSEPNWTTVLIITDSVRVTGDAPLPAWAEQTRRSLTGQRMRLRIAPDGHSEVVEGGAEGAEKAEELRAVLAQMPAMLPRSAIQVGDTWMHILPLPAPAPGSGGLRGGTIRATFTFDSVGRGGDLAYVSMRGVLARETAAAESTAPGYEMSGTLLGSLVVDRRRGWLTSSRTTLVVQTVIVPPRGVSAKPMKVRMKVSQWLRAL